MGWFRNLAMRAKLMVSFGMMIALLLIVVVAAYLGIKAIQESERKLFEMDFANAEDLLTLNGNLERARADTLTMLVVTKRSELDPLSQEVREYSNKSDDLLRKLAERNQQDATFVKVLDDFRKERDAFKQIRDREVIPAILDGKAKEAEARQHTQTERFGRMRTMVMDLAKNAQVVAKKAVDQSAERAAQSVIIFGVASILTVVLAIVLVGFLNRIIADPLKDISASAKQIADGNLKGEKLPVLSGDEIGGLAEVFNHMLLSLRTLTGQTLDITQNLNAAAAQIMASTQEQAASTREQAATVQEITTTMEQVTQSGSQISQKAKQVAAAAEATSAASNSGLQAVQQSTQTMAAIREQVEEVAENIVALSEKTQAVGEIIATVNDIAERSNLLALNAAIEAAAVGEQGNRFSVVANEMKNLADQAKESTVQVRTILGEIQKGINTSVMLTEEGVKRVEIGKQQADVAEQTIREMAKTTLDSVQAFEQIIGAGNQQQIGFEQVAQGMKDIRQAAGQTAAATAQLEKAVVNLNSLSGELKKAVGRYQV